MCSKIYLHHNQKLHFQPIYATTRHKGKETAKPITPPSESSSKEDSNPEQAQKDKKMQKNLALIAKKLKNGEQSDWLADTDEEIDEQELEAHYSYMAKIQEVPNADSGTDSKPLVQDHLHLCAPTAHDIEILIKTCLMPLALKTQNDSLAFVHELKQEMQCDLKYVESLEKEMYELESDKAEFSNMYDMLLQECVSNDVMCFYLHSLSNLDTHAELQCLYVHKVKECECLAQKLSKQTETVSKKFYNDAFTVTHRTNVSRPQTRNTQIKDKVVPNISQVKYKKTEVEDHHRISSISNQTKYVTACNDSLKSKTLNVNAVCAKCGKCVFNSNHDAFVSKYLIDVNARTKKPKVVPISTRKPKSQANKSVATHRKKIVALEFTVQNSKSYYRMLYEKTSKAWKWWIEQQCPSGYK
ncbi:hypothetical protein Tco_1054465 [Tanacetum coccineum]|uniref:Uncharacterized protein n=1 Tax=Tanacetum coccineum TaxID=301880 RepID=A0ABQ5GZ94_9ASTR